MGGKWSTQAYINQTAHVHNGLLDNHHVTLSANQKDLIKDTWKVVTYDMKEFGVQFFLRFFHEHEAYKDFFAAFQDVNLEDLGTSLVLRAHGIMVMQTLMRALEYLDEPVKFKTYMYRIVRIHYDSGVRLQHFQEMFTLLIQCIAERYDGEFDAVHYDTWQIVCNIMMKNLSDILHAIEAEYVT